MICSPYNPMKSWCKSSFGHDIITSKSSICEVCSLQKNKEVTAELPDEVTAELPDSIDPTSEPTRSSSRVHVLATIQAILEVVQKQKEAEDKAKALQEQLAKFIQSPSVKSHPRRKRKVKASHCNCMVSAYFYCGIQVQPVVFDTTDEDNLH